MKKGVWAPALAAVCVLTACASIPTKSAESDSLVVIKTEVSNPSGLPRGYEILFHYSGGSKDSLLGEHSWDYSLVVVKKPGAVLTSYSATLQPPFRGDSSVTPVNVALPYSPGSIVIADFVFMVKITQTGMYEFSTGTGLRRISEQEKVDLMWSLQKDERFANWMRPAPEGPKSPEASTAQSVPEAQEPEPPALQSLPEAQASTLPESQETIVDNVLPAASFRIDGNLAHWNGIPPAFLGKGLLGRIHINKVFLAADASYLYMRFDVNDASSTSFLNPDVFDASRPASYGLDLANGPLTIRAHVYLVPAHGAASSQWYTEIDSHVGGRWKVIDSTLSANARKGASLEASFPLELIRKCLGIPAATGEISMTARTGYIDSVYGMKGMWTGIPTEGEETSWRKLQTPWRLIEGSGDTTETRRYKLSVAGQL